MINKILNLLFIIVCLLAIISCNDKEPDPTIVSVNCDSCNLLSELITKTNFIDSFSCTNNYHKNINIQLNDEAVNIGTGERLNIKTPGFYELQITDTYNNSIAHKLFTVISSSRGPSEWGLSPWTPKAFTEQSLTTETINIISPHKYINGINLPFIFSITDNGQRSEVYLKASYPETSATFNIKQGIGSVALHTNSLNTTNSFMIGSKEASVSLVPVNNIDRTISGVISTHDTIYAEQVINIPSNIEITEEGSLTIYEGAIITIDPGVNIYNNGPIVFQGTGENPIFITCSKSYGYWGGFISNEANATITMSHTIITQSGYNTGADYRWGHANRQALFYTANSTLNISHSYFIDHIGQIFYPTNSTVNLNHVLVQRAKTGGEFYQSHANIKNSIFTDFPDDSDTFRDQDNDAIYLKTSSAIIDSCIFMYAKDDGLDSGSGGEGDVTVTNSRFEACFHEGAALSCGGSAVKTQTFTNCIFTNNQQGIELGFSSEFHQVIADNCQFFNNQVGIRIGDNYDWSRVLGHLYIKNSFCYNNVKNSWNMSQYNWEPLPDQLHIENTDIVGINSTNNFNAE